MTKIAFIEDSDLGVCKLPRRVNFGGAKRTAYPLMVVEPSLNKRGLRNVILLTFFTLIAINKEVGGNGPFEKNI